jgi:hypothetical protein
MMTWIAPVVLAFVLLAFGSDAAAQETSRMGGVLKVATIGEPPTLDIPMATAVITYEIMWHVNETLFTSTPTTGRIRWIAIPRSC